MPLGRLQRVQLGDRVTVDGGGGTVRYVGFLRKAANPNQLYCGIECDSERGLSDGSVFGESYFACAPKRGCFVPLRDVCRPTKRVEFTAGTDTLPETDGVAGDFGDREGHFELLFLGIDTKVTGRILAAEPPTCVSRCCTVLVRQNEDPSGVAASAQRSGWRIRVARGCVSEAVALSRSSGRPVCAVVAGDPSTRARRSAELARAGLHVAVAPPVCVDMYGLRELERLAVGWQQLTPVPVAELQLTAGSGVADVVRALVGSEALFGEFEMSDEPAITAVSTTPLWSGADGVWTGSWSALDVAHNGGALCSAEASQLMALVDTVLRPASTRFDGCQDDRYIVWPHDTRLDGAVLWSTDHDWRQYAVQWGVVPRIVLKVCSRMRGKLPASCLRDIASFAAASMPQSMGPNLRAGGVLLRTLTGGAAAYSRDGVRVQIRTDRAAAAERPAANGPQCWSAADVTFVGTRSEIQLRLRAGSAPAFEVSPVVRRRGESLAVPISSPQRRRGCGGWDAAVLQSRPDVERWAEHRRLGAADAADAARSSAADACRRAVVDAVRGLDAEVEDGGGGSTRVTVRGVGDGCSDAGAASAALERAIRCWTTEGRTFSQLTALTGRWRLLCRAHEEALRSSVLDKKPP
eukprot:TRINITY_DN1141_c9_g1_i1.p1 TRINITY_DN1141_c9_g1~~TRINITY_DN1141_c9_g1_i1.p1  ORF type:complete len:635 (+),score=121.17 TRINITY_DN1141_c9_g1_i1:75-1979(+)